MAHPKTSSSWLTWRSSSTVAVRRVPDGETADVRFVKGAVARAEIPTAHSAPASRWSVGHALGSTWPAAQLPASPVLTSPHTRRAYAMARRQLAAWLDDRPLDDASLSAYLGHLHEAGRAPATPAMVIAAVKRAARDAATAVPIGPLTRHALKGFRRTVAADAPPRRGQARGLTADDCATVLTTCHRPRRTTRGLVERPKTAARPRPGRRYDRDGSRCRRSQGLVDLVWGRPMSTTAAIRRRRSAGRPPPVSPEPGDAIVGLSVDQINRPRVRRGRRRSGAPRRGDHEGCSSWPACRAARGLGAGPTSPDAAPDARAQPRSGPPGTDARPRCAASSPRPAIGRLPRVPARLRHPPSPAPTRRAAAGRAAVARIVRRRRRGSVYLPRAGDTAPLAPPRGDAPS